MYFHPVIFLFCNGFLFCYLGVLFFYLMCCFLFTLGFYFFTFFDDIPIDNREAKRAGPQITAVEQVLLVFERDGRTKQKTTTYKHKGQKTFGDHFG